MVWKQKNERVQRSVERLLSLLPPEFTLPVPLETIAQVRGIRLRYVPYEGEMMGLLLWEDGVPVIGVNTRHDTIWQRFTIAHEMAHIEMHHHNGIHIDRCFPMPLHMENSSQELHQHEIEASMIAAELLVPTALLEADLRGQHIDYLNDAIIYALAQRYQVSMQTLLLRLAQESVI